MQIYTNTDYCLVAFCTWIPSTTGEALHLSSHIDLTALKLTDWDEMTSDFAIQRWCFSGLAAHVTKKVSAHTGDRPWANGSTDGGDHDSEVYFMNDWDWMSGFEVRSGFEQYGATAFFNKEGGLLKIWRSKNVKDEDSSVGMNITKGHALWEHAKWSFKCTVLTGVTLRDHLVYLHFMASNILATTTVETMRSVHPIRIMLRPHVWGTTKINVGASRTLSVPLGLVHRSTALTWDALEDAYMAVFKVRGLAARSEHIAL
jgi:hypothetical protein